MKQIDYSPDQARAVRGLTHLVRLVLLMVLLALVLATAGCGTVPQTITVKVPVPVECRVPVPDRPAMPTDALAPAFTLDMFVAAVAAEIELREGYELQLQVALATCTAPIAPAP